MPLIDMRDQKFHKWTVLGFDHYDHRREAYWLCRCECGNVKCIAGYTLRKGTSKGCSACRKPYRLGSKYTVEGDIAYFTSLGGDSFTVSVLDAERVSSHAWCLSRRDGYFVASVDGARAVLHNFLIGSQHGMYVDHINGNKADNRRANLRIVTPTQSAWNIGLSSLNTSGYKGVHWNKREQRWQANIRAHNKQFFLGWFPSREAAALAYNEAAKALHGEYACLNPIGNTDGYRVLKVSHAG